MKIKDLLLDWFAGLGLKDSEKKKFEDLVVGIVHSSGPSDMLLSDEDKKEIEELLGLTDWVVIGVLASCVYFRNQTHTLHEEKEKYVEEWLKGRRA